MAKALDLSINLLLPTVILIHLFFSPYTRVEESFNIQAAHDILAHGLKFSSTEALRHIEQYYDHVSFPGSVPRTFTGALLLAGVTQPFAPWLGSSENAQFFVRALLGLTTAASFLTVRYAVDTAFGKVAGRWYVILQTTQFHMMYYASRTLPNIFALALTNAALSCLILANTNRSSRSNRRRLVALYCLTFAGIVFRSEIAILLALYSLQILVQQRASLTETIIPSGIAGVLAGLTVTVPLDSLLWRRWTWPELEGFYYNTILGKSSDWGTSPFHFYLTNAVPRLLFNPIIYLLLLPIVFATRSIARTSRDILLPQLGYILIYSLLPHKEWRFVIYTIPAFTAVAAGGAAWIWNRRSKNVGYQISAASLIASTMVSYLFSIGFLYVSSLNYPGGEALQLLHRIESAPGKQIYLDNLACQTGVTRFLQIQPTWTYDKTESEDQLLSPVFWQKFDYVIAEDPKRVIGSWQIKDTVVGYDGITLRPGELEDVIPLSASAGGIVYTLQTYYNMAAHIIRSRLTRGLWPAIKMRTKLYILEKERSAGPPDAKFTIQM